MTVFIVGMALLPYNPNG